MRKDVYNIHGSILVLMGRYTLCPQTFVKSICNTRFPLLRRFSQRKCNALHCGYSGITDIQDDLFFVLTRARTFIYHYNHNAKRHEKVIRGIINRPCA
jgi:hypothetical protein